LEKIRKKMKDREKKMAMEKKGMPSLKKKRKEKM
jgi:hypothetical protein